MRQLCTVARETGSRYPDENRTCGAFPLADEDHVPTLDLSANESAPRGKAPENIFTWFLVNALLEKNFTYSRLCLRFARC